MKFIRMFEFFSIKLKIFYAVIEILKNYATNKKNIYCVQKNVLALRAHSHCTPNAKLPSLTHLSAPINIINVNIIF